MTIDEIRDLDDQVFDDFQHASTHLHSLLYESEIPCTTEICFMFMSGSNFLKNSIFDCAENDDFYSLNVLFRSLIEHYLRFMYFWFKNTENKDDSYAFKFRTALDFSENIAIEKSINAVRHIRKMEIKSNDTIWEELLNWNETYSRFSKVEIEEFSKELSIKNIIRYIEKLLADDKVEKNDFLVKMIVQYSKLSSFVHGGVMAHREMVKFETSHERQKGYIALCGLAFQAASFIKLLSYLSLYQFKADFGPLYNNTESIIRKLKSTT